jgi:hypothetical protein
MLDRTSRFFKPFRARIAPAAATMLLLTIAAGTARSQTAPPPSSPETQAPIQQAAPGQPAPVQPGPEPAKPPHENPGLISEIGKMFGKLPGLKSPSETIDDLNERAKDTTKDASDTLSRLAKPLMVTGRTACPVSPNGAPDCKSASDHGFGGEMLGESADPRQDAEAGRLPHRQLRHRCAMPVARGGLPFWYDVWHL